MSTRVELSSTGDGAPLGELPCSPPSDCARADGQASILEPAADYAKIIHELEARDRLIQGTADAMHALMTSVDARDALPRALALLGEAATADRVYLFEFHPSESTGEPVASQRAEWAREGVRSFLGAPALDDLSLGEHFPEWDVALRRGEPVSCIVEELLSPGRQHLEEQDIRSLLVVPVIVGGRVWGFIGFDDCHNQRVWSLAERAALQSTAGALGTAFQRARAEADLLDANRRFEQIAQNTPGAVFQCRIDRRGRWSFPYISGGNRSVFGRDVTVLRERPELLDEFLHQEEREGFWGSIAEAVSTGSPWAWEGRCVDEEGRVHWVSAVARHHAEQDGATLWHGLFLDVTDRRESELALERTERRHAAIFDGSLDAILLADDEARYIDANVAATDLLGYARHELCGMAIQDMFQPDDRRAAMAAWQAFLEAGEMEGESRLLRRDGSVVVTEYRATANVLPGVHLSVVRDITARKAAEEALSDSEERFRQVAQTAPVMIWITDVRGGVTFLSEQWAAFTGRPLGEELGEGWLNALHPDDQARCLKTYTEAFERQERYEAEYRLQRHDGAYRWVVDRGLPRFANNGDFLGYIGTCTDIHERKEHEQELVAARVRAEEAARLKSALLANMSHEIRTPLTAIIGFADVLAETVTDVDADLVEHISLGARRLFDTLNSVLDFAQLEAGEAVITFAPVDLREVVREAVSLFRRSTADKGLELHIDLPDEPLLAQANRSALSRVVANLVGNAIKFTAQGFVEVGARSAGAFVELWVRDSGAGIGEEFMPHLFDAFRQESEGSTRRFEGNGLGLAITKRLIDVLGGSIEVQSRKGEGSTFTVALPKSLTD